MIWNVKKRKVNFCGWFIHRTIRWILLFLIWPSELRGQHCTRAVLHKSDCFEYPLKFLLKSNYNQKCLQVFIFSKVSYPQRNPVMKKFKTKKKSLYHLGNFNSPLQVQPPAGAGPRVKHYCLRCSFWLLVVVRHFSPFLCLSWFLSVWKYPNALCNCIATCCIKPV